MAGVWNGTSIWSSHKPKAHNIRTKDSQTNMDMMLMVDFNMDIIPY